MSEVMRNSVVSFFGSRQYTCSEQLQRNYDDLAGAVVLHSISRINADCLVIGFNFGRRPAGSPAAGRQSAGTNKSDGWRCGRGGVYRGEASVDVFEWTHTLKR